MWITEGTYDKDYVETHTVGFDKMQGVRPGRGRRCSQDAGVGLAQVRRAGLDHQGSGPRLGQEDRHHRPLLRRRHGPRPVLHRAGPPRVRPARHAGPGQTGRPSGADRLHRHAEERHHRRRRPYGPVRQPEQPAVRRAPAQAAPRNPHRLGQADDPQGPHRRGHPATASASSGAPAATKNRPPTSTGATSTPSRRRRAAPRST